MFTLIYANLKASFDFEKFRVAADYLDIDSVILSVSKKIALCIFAWFRSASQKLQTYTAIHA